MPEVKGFVKSYEYNSTPNPNFKSVFEKRPCKKPDIGLIGLSFRCSAAYTSFYSMVLFTSFSRAGLVKVVLLPEMLGTAVEVFRLLVAELWKRGQAAAVPADAGGDAVLYFVDAAAHLALNRSHDVLLFGLEMNIEKKCIMIGGGTHGFQVLYHFPRKRSAFMVIYLEKKRTPRSFFQTFERCFRIFRSLLCGLAVPSHGFVKVLCHAQAVFVANAKIALGGNPTLRS